MLMTRRHLLKAATSAFFGGSRIARATEEHGAQRLSLGQLARWEALGYGMFLHFGISTFDGHEWSDGNTAASAFMPDKLDVNQWIGIARDAGMKYAVLTTKHVSGFCLWPSRYTDYSVAKSPVKTDIVGTFVKSCESRGVQPGFYYCSFDNHHRFGSVTPDHAGMPIDTVEQVHEVEKSGKAFTTSVYQDFQLNQITELLTRYGKISEFWLDEPGVLGLGYRTFLYHHIAALQPECVVLANGSYGDVKRWDPWFTWPQDILGYEIMLPPKERHVKWRTVEGRRYYLPAEVYDLLGRHWFWVDGDEPRPDADLQKLFRATRKGGANLLLDVPPDRRGLISEAYRQALMRLAKSMAL